MDHRVAIPVLTPTAALAATGKVLILANTVTGGASSIEAQEAASQGYTVDVVDDATWSGMTSAQFASYRAIVLGDATCTSLFAASAAVANASVWGHVVNGNIEIVGTDPVFHDSQGGDAVTRRGVDFAASQDGKTGAYISLSCYYAGTAENTPVPLLDGISPGGFEVGGAGCSDRIHMVGTSAALAGSTDATLSNWSCSVHEAFDKWPQDSFAVLSIDIDLAANYTAPDGTRGRPYILAAPRSAVPPVPPTSNRGSGNPARNPTTCNNGPYPVNCESGNFWHTFTDLAVRGRGPALDLQRTYNAQGAGTDGPFGFGWSASYTMSLSIAGASGVVTVTQENGSTVTFTPTSSGSYDVPSSTFASLVANSDGTFTFTRRQRERFVFSAAGQLLRESDLNGYVTSLGYDGGQVASVTDPAGRTLKFTHGADGRVSSVSDPAGRTVSYAYDATGNLLSATDPAGGVTRFTYDANHLMLTMTDPKGGVVTNTYDSASRVVAQSDPLGRKTTYAYASSGTTITDPRGNVELQNYADGTLTSLTKAAGTAHTATWTYQYDPATLGVAQSTDPNGSVTRNTWDVQGNLTSTTDALGHLTAYTYDRLADRTSATDPLGVTTTYTYDANGNLIGTSRPLTGAGLARTASLAYGDSAHPGDVTSLVDPNGHSWTFAYGTNGDLVSVTDPDGNVTTYGYDGIGRRTSMVSPKGNAAGASPAAFTTKYTYDPLDDLTSTTDPLGHVTGAVFDANRNVLKATDANGHVTVATYDADNEPTTATRADGTVVATAYDANGNVVSQTDAAGAATTYTYDALDRVVSMADPLGRKTAYAYDPAGNRTALIDPADQTTSYRYDALRQLTGISYTDGKTPNVGYTYDAAGRRLSMADGTGTSTYQYDSLNRLVSARDGSGAVVGYGYDLAGQLTSLVYPNGKTVTRSYDAAGQLTAVADWLGNTTSFGYDRNSNLATEGYPNGVLASSAYDNADRLTSIIDTKGTATLAGFNYTRDNAGQLTSANPSGVGASPETYTYTALSQLASVNGAAYSYDRADNLVRLPNGTTQRFDAANELLSSTPVGTTETAGPAPVADQVVSASQTTPASSIASPALMTGAGGELVLAFVSADGPASPTQGISSVSGGGLSWSLVARANSAWGTAEVWAAYATDKLSGAVVTAALAASGYDAAITVATFTGAAPLVGASAVGAASSGPPGVTLTTTRANSLLWAVGQDYRHAVARTPNSGQKLIKQTLDTRAGETFWTQATTSPVSPAGTTVNVGDSAPTGDRWDLAAVEIVPAPAGSPGFGTDTIRTTVQATPASSFSSPSVSTSSSGELLLALVSTDGPKQPTQAVASVTGGGLTWTRAARANVAWGAAEVWQAYAASPVSGVTVTATLANAGFDGSITVATFRGAQPATGATAAQAATSGVPAVSLTTTAAGSTVWGVGHDWTRAATVTAASGQTLVNQFVDTAVHDNSWVQQTGPISAAGTAVSVAVTGPTTDRWDMAAVEVVPAQQAPTGQATTYTYDSRGNRVSATVAGGPTTTLAYDQANRLVGYGTTATYGYNGDGLRTSKVVSGAASAFVWDQSGALPMLLSDGGSYYVYGPGGAAVEQVSGGTVTYLHQDQQGSTRVLTDSAGKVVGTYSFDPYGNAASHSGPATSSLQYDGEYLDGESGFYYLRARYYDPGSAQFVGRDPIVDVTRQPYQYGFGAPLDYVDPNGELAFLAPLIGAAIGAGVGTGAYLITHAIEHKSVTWQGAALAAGTGAVTGALAPIVAAGVVSAGAGAVAAQLIGVGVSNFANGFLSSVEEQYFGPSQSVNVGRAGVAGAIAASLSVIGRFGFNQVGGRVLSRVLGGSSSDYTTGLAGELWSLPVRLTSSVASSMARGWLFSPCR